MAWDGNGSFTRTNGVNTGSGVWTADRDASVKITASRHDTHDQDLAAGINACLAKNGENAMTGDLNLGTNDITNGGAATFSGALAAGATTITGAMTASGAVTGSTVSDASGNVRSGRRNLLINGGFDVWQRAASQTSSGYGSADRWTCTHNGSTKTASQHNITLGETLVPGVRYGIRHAVTSSANAANYARMVQRIEGVRSTGGKTLTLSFYAKADASCNIAVDLGQDFGTGGSPSTAVESVGAQKFALTTGWQRFTATIDMPSVSGKTLGSDGNDHAFVRFWFDAGSNYNTQTASLGQQSRTVDITCVQLEIGSAATTFEVLPVGETLALCQRYYEAGKVLTGGYQVAGNGIYATVFYNAFKRVSPALTIGNDGSVGTTGSFVVSQSNQQSGLVGATKDGSTGSYFWRMDWNADAEL